MPIRTAPTSQPRAANGASYARSCITNTSVAGKFLAKGPAVIGFPDHGAKALNGPVRHAAKDKDAPRWVLSLAGKVKTLMGKAPNNRPKGTAMARFLAAIK